ncbi:hypothetical protein FRC12_012964 [Ceratobasidium sp. 428]|nr:hypothetical protein FRC12_012964 [Ceratobasidium sp. 428]
MTSMVSYSDCLSRLRIALRSLPPSLPRGSTVYNFSGWTPDPEGMDKYGAECSVLNAHLETVFGLRAVAPIKFRERGSGIESLVTILAHYLEGEYAEKPVLAKWVDDLIDAAESASTVLPEKASTKRVSKPSAAQKRSNEWVELTTEATAARKRQKAEAIEKADRHAKLIEKSSQRVNWKKGLDDLVDVQPEPKPQGKKKGRPTYEVVDKLVIECVSQSTNQRRWRCAASGCQQSWASRQAARVLSHATEECRSMPPELRDAALAQAGKLSPGHEVDKLNAAIATQVSQPCESGSQPSVQALVLAEGREAKQTRFDLSLINFISVSQIAPRKVDLPQFHELITLANPRLTPKSSSHIAHSQIPMESARIRCLFVDELRVCRNLTLSFDGGSAIRPQSFTTIHVTNPDTRFAYLMNAVEASGVSHTGDYYFKELEKVIEEIGPLAFSGITCDSTGNTRLARELVHKAHPTIIVLPDPCHQLHNAVKDITKLEYFHECKSRTRDVVGFCTRSNIAATHVDAICGQLGITEGFKKSSKTRFAGWYDCARSTRRRLPAVEKVVHLGVFKDHKLYFVKNLVAFAKFKTELLQLEKVLEPLAKAIKCLESGYSNPSDVFLFYLGILSTYRQLFDDNDAELCLPRDVITSIISIICARYFSMVLAAGQEVYLAAFFLHPVFLNTDILRRNNLNPLKAGTLVLRPQPGSSSDDIQDLLQTFPSFNKFALYLKNLFCIELEHGTIPAAANYGSDEADVDELVEAFRAQLIGYARGKYPFLAPSSISADFQPLKYWKTLQTHPDASLLAPLAVKLFSVVPNSMAEERTMSNFTAVNTKYRSNQNVSTITHMTRIRQHALRTDKTSKPRFKPVLKFRDLSSTLLRQRDPIRSVEDEEVAEDEAAEASRGDGEDQDEWENDSEDGESEDVSPDALGLDVVKEYGVNLGSPTLLDLLADQPIEGASVLTEVPKVIQKSRLAKGQVSAKKDTKGVDRESF